MCLSAADAARNGDKAVPRLIDEPRATANKHQQLNQGRRLNEHQQLNQGRRLNEHQQLNQGEKVFVHLFQKVAVSKGGALVARRNARNTRDVNKK